MQAQDVNDIMLTISGNEDEVTILDLLRCMHIPKGKKKKIPQNAEAYSKWNFWRSSDLEHAKIPSHGILKEIW